MIGLGYEFAGFARVESAFVRLDREIGALKPLWERFQREFQAEETALFEAAPFAPLSPDYAQQKERRFPGSPVLQATQTLLKSLTQDNAEGSVRRIDDLEAEFGSEVFYGIFHQFGTGRMPARPPLAEPEVDRYQTIAGEYVEELISKAGFN